MRWINGRRSSNIEDRRSIRLSRGVKGGGIGMLLLVIVAIYFGVDPSIVLQHGTEMSGKPSIQTIPVQPSAADNELAEFVSVVLADTEDTWKVLFKQMGGTYEEALNAASMIGDDRLQKQSRGMLLPIRSRTELQHSG
jgi:predicted metalloprotease